MSSYGYQIMNQLPRQLSSPDKNTNTASARYQQQ